MNTLLTPAPQRPAAAHHAEIERSHPPHTGLLDRWAMHLGLRLILWGQRMSRLTAERESHRLRDDVESARRRREAEWARAALLDIRR